MGRLIAFSAARSSRQASNSFLGIATPRTTRTNFEMAWKTSQLVQDDGGTHSQCGNLAVRRLEKTTQLARGGNKRVGKGGKSFSPTRYCGGDVVVG